jgi:hypothetical protein
MTWRMRACFVFALVTACSTRTDNLASSRTDADVEPGAGDGGADGGWGTPIVTIDAGVLYCGAQPCSCSNGRDDDGDTLIDALDPECTGPADDVEDSLAIGVHGESEDVRCQDCFYDQNSGAGDDGCSRARTCRTDPSAGGAGACASCEVAPRCQDHCMPLAPNGCDCFGCCSVFRSGVSVDVLLVSTCTVAMLDDVAACPRCVPAPDCLNPCGPCELCTGRSVADLPPMCASGGGPGFTCDEAPICLDASDCGAGAYCQQGCCVQLVF